MRIKRTQGGLTVQAVVGDHAAFLGFDLTPEARKGCLGFALHRVDHTENESYWLPGFKTFRSVVPNPTSTVIYPSNQHPVQSMWWGDYSAKPTHDYTYTIVPVYGTPAAPVVDDATSVSLDVATGNPDTGVHGIYFNRGVAASQAYATKFGQKPSDLPPAKQAEAMTWLSRGLHEALIAFITTDTSPHLVIRAAVYEFTEPSVLAAFAQAHAAGADVKIVYHDKAGDDQSTLNEKAIADAHLDPGILLPRRHTTIAHNKFIVRATRAADGTLTGQQVWTGSTNLSQGGIFGHSNVGHAVRDPAVADAYLAYWAQLSTDPAAHPLKTWVSAHSPLTPPADTPPLSARCSARVTNSHPWTGTRSASPTAPRPPTSHCRSGMDNKHFEPAIAAMAAHGPLKFVMLNTRDNHQQVWSRDHAIQVAVGAEGGPDDLSRWAQETLTGFNTHVDYLHTKILLVGVLGTHPTIISGSANFSEASTTSNDENMLIISGDSDAADVYFTEYARIFQHFYARWWAAQLSHTPSIIANRHPYRLAHPMPPEAPPRAPR